MNLSLSLDDVYQMLAGLSLDNKRWLAERLTVDIANEGAKAHNLEYPHIPHGRPISPKVLAMVAGRLPEGFDVEKETDNMWEEFAR